MHHVWIVNHYAVNPNLAGGTRHHGLARYSKLNGWEATIIAANPSATGSKCTLAAGSDYAIETAEGVRYLWVRAPAYNGNGLLRISNMCWFAMRLVMGRVTSELPRPAVVVGSTVHPLAAFAAAIIARLERVPFVFEIRDLWPETLIEFGKISRKGLLAWMLRSLETWLLKSASRIIVLLPGAIDYVVDAGVDRTKVKWIPNGVEIRDSHNPESDVDESFKEATFTLMYFGSIGEANGLECLIAAMKNVQRTAPSVRLRIIGDGPRKRTLIKMSESLALSNVSFENPVPKAEIPALASQAHAFVLCVRNLPGLYKYGISMNKLYDYLAAGRPVLIASAALNNPVREAEAGICVPPDDPDELGRGILELISLSRRQREQMGIRGRAYVLERHSYQVLAQSFAEVLAEAVGENLEKSQSQNRTESRP
jgi:glycosyltransferase involved in cell wall biosynthesis